MMIKSMTAFSRGDIHLNGEEWMIEIKTVNHRFFEFSARLPQGLHVLENKIREDVQKHLSRGKIALSISCNRKEENKTDFFKIDEKLLTFYLKEIKKTGKRLNLPPDIRMKDLLGLPGVLSVKTNGVEPEAVWLKLRKKFEQTVLNVVKARQIEGEKLGKDILSRLTLIKKSVAQIQDKTAGEVEATFTKLCLRLEQLIPDKEIDKDRLYREAALLAERSDVTEEIVRLNGHIGLFEKKLNEKEPVGRELDFLCQEMNREANTMASKAQIFDVSKLVIQIKSEIEKIREQVQNIE